MRPPARDIYVPSSNARRRSHERLGGLDALRAVAAVSVFFYHARLWTFVILPGPLEAVSQGGGQGVILFFALSGFLLFRGFAQGSQSLGTYVRRRFLRIVPAYVVALGGVAVLNGSLQFWQDPVPFLLFVKRYGGDDDYLSIAWTLQAEALFYVVLPIAAVALRRLRLPGQVAALSLAGAASLFLFLTGPMTLSGNDQARMVLTGPFIYMFWAFVPGMILAAVEASRRDLLGIFGDWWIAVTGTVLLWAGMTGGFFGGSPWWGFVLTSAGSALLIGWVVVRGPSVGALGWAGGALSYAFYLWHLDILTASRGLGLGAWETTFVALGTAIAVAAASYLLVERPARNLRPSRAGFAGWFWLAAAALFASAAAVQLGFGGYYPAADLASAGVNALAALFCALLGFGLARAIVTPAAGLLLAVGIAAVAVSAYSLGVGSWHWTFMDANIALGTAGVLSITAALTGTETWRALWRGIQQRALALS